MGDGELSELAEKMFPAERRKKISNRAAAGGIFKALGPELGGGRCKRIHCESSSFMLIFKLSLSLASLPLTEIVDKDESRS